VTREERRKAMPTCAEWIDHMREHFPDLTVIYAREGEQSWGEPAAQGVPLTPNWKVE
jgi:hypothetical protein